MLIDVAAGFIDCKYFDQFYKNEICGNGIFEEVLKINWQEINVVFNILNITVYEFIYMDVCQNLTFREYACIIVTLRELKLHQITSFSVKTYFVCMYLN